MVLRFRILEPDTSSPDYNFCGQGLNVLGKEDLSLRIYVDNQQVFYAADLSNPIYPAPITTTNNSIPVTIDGLINDDYMTVTIDMPYIHSSTSVRIIVSKDNYNTFDKTFKVYGYDLGNNPNVNDNLLQPLVNNSDMDIVLIKNNIGNLVRAFSKFTYIREPYTNNVYLYNMSSIGGKFNYHDVESNTIISPLEDTKICLKKEVTLYLTNIKYINSNNDGVAAICNSEPIVIKKFSFIPNLTANFSCQSCNDECLSLINSNTGTIFLNFDSISHILINDTAYYYFNKIMLTYTIYDSLGNVVYFKEKYLNNIEVPYYYNFVDAEVNDIVLQSKGDYIAKVTAKYSKYNNFDTDVYTDVYTCSYNTLIKGCEWFRTKTLGCNEYQLTNDSLTNIDVTIYKYNLKLSVFIAKETITIPMKSVHVYNFTEDGVYKFETHRDNKTYTIIQPIFCNLTKCYFEFVKKALCLDMCKCVNKEYVYKANMFIAKYDIFMINLTKAGFDNKLYIDSEYQQDYIFIHRLDEILNSLYKYCQDCFKDLQHGCGCK